MIRARLVWVVGLVVLLSGTVGCSTASVSGAPPKSAAAPSSSGPTAQASSTPTSTATGPSLTSVPGYAYGEPPAGLKQSFEAMTATGRITSTVARGLKDSSGTEVGAIILMQYNPKMTVTTRVLSGHEVRLVQGDSVSFVIAYMHGGVLLQVAGPTAAPVLKFAGAYLAATG